MIVSDNECDVRCWFMLCMKKYNTKNMFDPRFWRMYMYMCVWVCIFLFFGGQIKRGAFLHVCVVITRIQKAPHLLFINSVRA